MNGGWSEWQKWGACTVACGGGEQSRSRTCNNPVPENGGLECTSDGSSNSESRTCQENGCAGTVDLEYVQGIYWLMYLVV